MEIRETDPSLLSVEAGGLFSRPKQTPAFILLPMGTWDLVSRFHCCPVCPSRRCHHEFLIRFLIGWKQPPPSWIWKIIASIVLQTIAYCLYRLLIGYCSFKRALLLSGSPCRYHFWAVLAMYSALTSFALQRFLFQLGRVCKNIFLAIVR